MIEDIDLEIENYSLEDLLLLFEFHIDFNEYDLKRAKKIVLMLHPDKSKLDSKYFLFYTKAYKKIYSIYEFKNKNNTKKEEFDYDKDIDMNIKAMLENTFENKKSFNITFNELFEKYKIERENDGYGEWLQGNDDIYDKIDLNDKLTLEKKKKEIQTLTRYNGIEDFKSHTQGSSIDGVMNNDSEMFSSLQYNDLRQAHRESIIPITEEDYNNIPKYKNINEYMKSRDMDMITINGETLSRRENIENDNTNYFNTIQEKEEREANRIAFLLAKQTEEAIKNNNLFMSEIYRLK